MLYSRPSPEDWFMRIFAAPLVALLATLPLSAAAQAAPPAAVPAAQPADPVAAPPIAQPAAAPVATLVAPPASQPPAAPPVAAAVAPAQPAPCVVPPATRDRWYIGFGLGGGSGRATETSGDRPLADWVDADHLTAFLQFQAGVTLTPGLLLGGELDVLRTSSDTSQGKKAAQISNVDAVLTWYPQEKGFFLRGGGGLTVFRREWPGLSAAHYPGANLSVGTGYAFWIGRTFNLSLHLDYSRQWYGSNALDLTGSSYTVGWLGFDWY
jgi:hypothetical protein